MKPCPSCQTTNASGATVCYRCSQPLRQVSVSVAPAAEASALLPTWAAAMQREIQRWQQDGLISRELAHQLTERYTWRQVVLTELERWQRDGLIPEATARQLRQQYAPPPPPPPVFVPLLCRRRQLCLLPGNRHPCRLLPFHPQHRHRLPQ